MHDTPYYIAYSGICKVGNMTVVVFVVVMFFVNMNASLTLSGAGENESIYIFSLIYLEEHT